ERSRSISSPPLAAFRSRRLSRIISNKGLNSNEALEESTATNSSVILSGIRREKEAPDGLDIEDYRPDSENSDRGRNQSQKSAVCQRESVLRRVRRQNMKCWSCIAAASK